MARPTTEKKDYPTSLRLSEIGKKLLEATADRLGLSQASTIEMAIRKLAYAEGIEVSLPKKEKEGGLPGDAG